MPRSDYFDDYSNLPNYYPTMYMDGFTFDQVYAASMNKRWDWLPEEFRPQKRKNFVFVNRREKTE